MDTGALKKFAQAARRQLLEQVAARMEQVLQTDSVEIREKEKAVNVLLEQINKSSKEAVVDRVAYTWFNRFCALRYMDVNHYTRIGIVSPQEGFTQPEILQEAKQGVIDDYFKVDNKKVVGLLNGQLPSYNPQQEAYRMLLVGACNAYYTQMPFLFPQIDDYTELLMPDDMLSENSVLQGVRETLTAEACKDVEVIGWLYQYYISERKDEIFASKKKIEAHDIPAATQQFTPRWIVRYLVENTLGRIWMLNHPNSNLLQQMDYFVPCPQPEKKFIQINSPEELKICDPACGSGHMLTYAFDLLYSIYEEQGYETVKIPSLILSNNLYGIEIDRRAGNLAAFSLMMKAIQKDSRFFSRDVEPNICILQDITFSANEINSYKEAVGRDLFTQDLWQLLQKFEKAKNFGSLIRPKIKNPLQTKDRLDEKGVFNDLILYSTNQKVQQALLQAEFLSPRYHIVLANPPFIGGKSTNNELKKFAKQNFSETKSNTYSMFIDRNLQLIFDYGYVGMITIPNWMFLSSFENARKKILSESHIISLIENGRGVWGSDFGSCSFILKYQGNDDFEGSYKKLFTQQGKVNANETLISRFFDHSEYPFYYSALSDFRRIPGQSIAYWASERILRAFEKGVPLSDIADPRQGMATSDNKRFLRYWSEVSLSNIGFHLSSTEEARESGNTWFPYNKGGEFRKWYGNNKYVVNWKNDGYEIKETVKNKYPYLGGNVDYVVKNRGYYFLESITWSFVSSSFFGVRYSYPGAIFDVGGSSVFPDKKDVLIITGFLCSKLATIFMKIINPTLNYQVGDVGKLPIIFPQQEAVNQINQIAKELIDLSKTDWDSYEFSWDFSTHPLINLKIKPGKISSIYKNLRVHWNQKINRFFELEKENNRIFINIYGLDNEISPEISMQDVTLYNNPYYRYPNSRRKKYSDNEREEMLLEDTMKEFISYGVGCMLGRYSLDLEGLILANTGETVDNYLSQVTEPSFKPDADNVIPVLDSEWFEDDIAERFKGFLKATFGEENFDENLAFLEKAIGRDIRGYFVKDFYKEHIKMYKKRPIYWMFSSPKGSFNALIYMHRYNKHTVSVILNDYLVQYRTKLSARRAMLENRSISASASPGEKTKALKEIDKINSILSELREYEDEILYPLATQQIEIDLDDGVKVNYNKFGKALKKVTGLSD